MAQEAYKIDQAVKSRFFISVERKGVVGAQDAETERENKPRGPGDPTNEFSFEVLPAQNPFAPSKCFY
jgi:hypothetical protein